MGKKFKITEEQLSYVVERKKQEKATERQILEEINNLKRTLAEGEFLTEGIVDVIRKYAKQGLVTAALVASLLSQNVNAQQLQQAGVPYQVIQQGMQMVDKNGQQVSLPQIEKTILQIMKQNGLSGTLRQYNALTPQQKQNILQGIKNNVKSLSDLQKYNSLSIGGWENVMRGGQNAIQFDQKTQQTIRVELVDTTASVPVTNHYDFNSAELKDAQALQTELQKIFNSYDEIDSIKVISSSSTLRNKNQAENMTWLELTQKRAQSVVDVISGMQYDLGGCGANKKRQITPDIITIDAKGTNGDGTSGPKSPYEVDQQYIQSYQSRGIDPKFWQSAAKDAPLSVDQLDQYGQYQYVIIQVYGKVVATETDAITNFRYLTMQIKQKGGKIQQGTNKTSADIGQCQLIGK